MLGYRLRDEPRQIYRLDLVEGGVEVSCSRTLVQEILDGVRNEGIKSRLEELNFREVEGDTRVALITLPYISFPNLSHKKADWEAMTRAARQLGTLLEQLNRRLEESSRFSMSDEPQLVAIECWCTEGAAPIAVSFSPLAKKLLVEHWREGGPLSKVQQEMTICYERLSTTKGRDFFRRVEESKRFGSQFFGSAAGIRKEEGTPSFTVPGNCACLGANPDRFKEDGDIDSHNMDTPLQLLTMMTGVISFWNDELRPRLSAS